MIFFRFHAYKLKTVSTNHEPRVELPTPINDGERDTGVQEDPNDAAGGLTKSFLEIRQPYVGLVHYPGSALSYEKLPAISFSR